jgi:hypothetical protein
MTFFKNILSVFSSSHKTSTKILDSQNSTQNTKVSDFINGKTTTLSAKDLFPDLKIFKPVKTPKNANIKELKVRLENAISFLHLPAAYKDILISLRMIIRLNKKEGKQYHSELELLYEYACRYNFLNSKPYLEKAQEPAFNLTELINYNEFNSLPMPYNKIGYKNITELSKTDVKWLISEFGEPQDHTSVSDLYKEKRNELESLLITQRMKENEALSRLIEKENNV